MLKITRIISIPLPSKRSLQRYNPSKSSTSKANGQTERPSSQKKDTSLYAINLLKISKQNKHVT
jgi:hypothetical protein